MKFKIIGWRKLARRELQELQDALGCEIAVCAADKGLAICGEIDGAPAAVWPAVRAVIKAVPHLSAFTIWWAPTENEDPIPAGADTREEALQLIDEWLERGDDGARGYRVVRNFAMTCGPDCRTSTTWLIYDLT